MKAISVKNLRSIRDSGIINLKNLNIFLGANSSGKSTMLRLFPLLRQSSEKNKTSPILWYGRLADFGSYKESVFMGDETKDIEINFKIPFIYLRKVMRFKSRRFGISTSPVLFSDDDYIDLTLILGTHSKKYTYNKRIILKYESRQFDLVFDTKGSFVDILLNGHSYKDFLFNSMIEQGYILPRFDTHPKYRRKDFNPFLREIYDKIKSNSHSNLKSNKIDSIVYQIVVFEPENELIDKIKNAAEMSKSWKTYLGRITSNNKKIINLIDLIYLEQLPETVAACDEYLKVFTDNIRYIEPLRATAERYYRFQELSVNEVDSRGQNLPIFIKNLSERDRKDFQSWTSSNFGFYATVKTSGGHYYLTITDALTNQEANLADTGFGYSQILPVITQLWHITRNNTDSRSGIYEKKININIPLTLVIEQPELHLHPKIQALFIDSVLQSIYYAKSREIDLRIIIETHSDTILNRVAQHFRHGNIRAEDIEITIFEKRDSGSELTAVHIDENGQFTNWPYGFFSPNRLPVIEI